MRLLWKWFLAYFRLSRRAVCEMSTGRDLYGDYHDYDDDELGKPYHFILLQCRRCGKKFLI